MPEDRINKKIAFGNNTQMQFSQWYGKVLYTFLYHEKGVVLLIVLATILVVVILSGAILATISNQSRLTHHQVSRIQSQYAAKAGIVYALEQLRNGTWVAGINCTEASPCSMTFQPNDFKPSILVNPDNGVKIIIRQPQSSNLLAPCYNPPGNSVCVSTTATYTYTP